MPSKFDFRKIAAKPEPEIVLPSWHHMGDANGMNRNGWVHLPNGHDTKEIILGAARTDTGLKFSDENARLVYLTAKWGDFPKFAMMVYEPSESGYLIAVSSKPKDDIAP